MKRALISLLLLCLLIPGVLAQVTAIPPLMSFVGRLANPDGTPVTDGDYTVSFTLFDAPTNGNNRWTETRTVTTHNGIFSIALGAITPLSTTILNNNVYLQIQIGNAQPLTPRQQLVSVAYAFKANTVPDNAITTSKIANGSITADKLASDTLNPLAWLLGGNSGVTSGFLGTTDNNPLELRVNNRRAMIYRYAANASYNSINVLGGARVNDILAEVVGGTIAGGGQDSFSGTDYPNRVVADFGTVGGGLGNTAGDTGVVGGGYGNTASGGNAFLGGGYLNTSSGILSTLGGGYFNHASGDYSAIGGGEFHTASEKWAVIGGGYFNTASNFATTVGGGYGNTASGDTSTVGGGTGNSTSGNFATIPGGRDNTAVGQYSFAAGHRAKANHDGVFVWADSMDENFGSTGINQFLIRAGGGVGINKNNPTAALDVNGTVRMISLQLPTGATNGYVLTSDASGNATWQPFAIPDGSITTPKLADNAVTTAKIAANAITTDKILDGAIGTADFAANAVTSPKIADGTILTADLADLLITTLKIADNAVTGAKIADGAVGSADLATNAVNSAKIADGTVGNADLATDAASLNRVSGGRMTVNASGYVGIGTTAPTKELVVNGTILTKVLQVVGGSDVAEPYNVAAAGDIKPVPGMVVCIDSEKVGQMKVAARAYDKTVAGILSGANGIQPGITLRQAGTIADGALPVASIGRVWCWCDADANGAIDAGDMLTTSNTPGHAMKVTDHNRANGAVIGKAMSSLKSGKGLVLVLVSLK